MVAENVSKDLLRKGITWNNCPACLTIRLKARHAESELAADGSPSVPGCDECGQMAWRMLGLKQKIEDFEEQYAAHPHLQKNFRLSFFAAKRLATSGLS